MILEKRSVFKRSPFHSVACQTFPILGPGPQFGNTVFSRNQKRHES
jgi:hypothetical protein